MTYIFTVKVVFIIKLSHFAESLSTEQPITPVVGFHVGLSKRWSGSGKVPFDRILSNYGNGWNRITHTFKVPTKGLYLLTLTVMSTDNKQAHVVLKRESTVVQEAYAAAGDYHNSGTTSTVLILNAGEHIYAEWRFGTLHPSIYNHLMGILIQKTY